MESTTHAHIDMAAANIVNQVSVFKANSQRLQLEAMKIDTVLALFNNCADRCNLQYRESGLKEGAAEDIGCFKNCLAKSHNLSQGMFQ